MQLISTNKLKSFQVIGKDGVSGRLDSLLFNSKTWQVKYIKIKRGFWMFKQEFLIPVEHLIELNRENNSITIDLTNEELKYLMQQMSARNRIQKNSTDKIANWVPGTGHHSISWTNLFSLVPLKKIKKSPSTKQETPNRNIAHLRSFEELQGYQVDASDGKVGQTKDFILDAKNWTVSYIIVKGSGKKIMLPSQWVKKIHHIYERLVLNQNKHLLLTSPYALG